MTCFSDLSNEIVLMISQHVQPRDCDNFYLTSKHIRGLNAAAVERHKKLKRRYKNINHRPLLDKFYPAKKIGTWASLLKYSLQSARTASYVEHLDIHPYNTSWLNDRRFATMENRRKEDMTSEANKKLFEEAIEDAKHIVGAEKTQWKQYFIDGREDQVLGLLFMLLPNLTTMNLSIPGGRRDLITSTIERISLVSKRDALTMLTHVTL